MKFAIYGGHYNGFWGTTDTFTRYISHIGFGLKHLGHEIIWYTETGYDKDDTFDVRQFNSFSPKDVDVVLTNSEGAESIATTSPVFIVSLSVDKPEKYPCISGFFQDEGTGYTVPIYIPPKEVDIPFTQRKHRIFVSTPTEELPINWKTFHRPIYELREGEFENLVTYNRNNRMFGFDLPTDMKADASQYAEHVLKWKNNHVHHWLDWREYLFLLCNSGIYCRYSFLDHKSGIVEALAYGNIVVLTHVHSTLLYDQDNVILLTDPTEGKVKEALRRILTDPYYNDLSEMCALKYQERHSLEEVTKALEVIKW